MRISANAKKNDCYHIRIATIFDSKYSQPIPHGISRP